MYVRIFISVKTRTPREIHGPIVRIYTNVQTRVDRRKFVRVSLRRYRHLYTTAPRPFRHITVSRAVAPLSNT